MWNGLEKTFLSMRWPTDSLLAEKWQRPCPSTPSPTEGKVTIPNLSLIELTVYEGYVATLVVDGVEPRLAYYAWESPSK